jgi:hypothetical protein
MISSARATDTLIFDDRREHLLVEDVLTDRARGHVAHQRRNRILLLERHTGGGQRTTHFLNVAEPNADARAPQLDREADLAGSDAAGHVGWF